jgi:SAM-dependent methyltransferase
MSKIHIGCGTVYLRDYINIDVPCKGTFLAVDRPDLVERYITDEFDYYSRHKNMTVDVLRKGALSQEYACDRYGSFFFIPCHDDTVDEILTRSVFEHLSLCEAEKALAEVKRVMTKDGIIRLDVPDHDETMRQFKTTGDDFFIRHLLGPRRTKYGYHMASYTHDTLKSFLNENGFKYDSEEPNIHPYPSFCLRFKKA